MCIAQYQGPRCSNEHRPTHSAAAPSILTVAALTATKAAVGHECRGHGAAAATTTKATVCAHTPYFRAVAGTADTAAAVFGAYAAA